MHSMLQDFRYGLGVLLNTRGFTAVAVLTLALGIGANTAIFSVVEAVVLKPLAIADPGRVVLLQENWRGAGGGGVSVGNFSDVREQNTVFESLAASEPASFNLAAADAPERISGERVSADYFATFQIQPVRGRVFSADENQPGRAQVAVVSERLETGGWGTKGTPQSGVTILDRVHQSMILFAAGRGEALRRFLIDEGIGKDEKFWRLAQILSYLYPQASEEKRWIDGVLARKKGLGFQ